MLRPYFRNVTPELIQRYRANGAWRDETLFDLMAERARLHPDRLGFLDSVHRLSFAEAHLLTRRLAHHFLDLGFGPGSVVALQAGNQVEYLLVRTALSGIGAITLSLPASLRQAEVSSILAAGDADAFCFPLEFHGFSHEEMALAVAKALPAPPRLIGFRGAPREGIVSLDELLITPALSESDDERLASRRPDPNADDIMSTTAGTTGMPKLFLRTHNSWNGMARNVLGVLEDARLTERDSLLALAPLPQGLGYVTGVHVPAVTPGLTTVLLEEWNPAEAVRLLLEHRCTVAASVPTQMIRMLEVQALRTGDLSFFRLMINGGAPLPPDRAEEFERVTGARIIHGYGASDVGTPTFCYFNDPPERRHSSVGRREPFTELAILGDDDRPLPAGETGEIAMSGPDVVSGYYKDEAATRARYSRSGLTRLGDLGYLDRDGYLHVVGRKHELIIRGGQNISPIEVEEHVSGHPDVSQVAIVGVPDPALGERVWAFVVAREGRTIDKHRIVEFLRRRQIATYKLPEEVVVLDDLPTSAGGKVKRAVLRELAVKRLEPTHAAGLEREMA